MRDFILQFPKQLLFEPIITGGSLPLGLDHFVILGMGGSALAAGLLQVWDPTIPLVIHRDYGLPHIADAVRGRTLIIASSFSGNTEEVLSGAEEAFSKKIPLLVITTGGALLAFAKMHRIPYIQLPHDGLQPRMALGVSFCALLAVMGVHRGFASIRALASTFKPELLEGAGEALARELHGRVPLIYASRRYGPLGYVWKITFNETGKIPAFTNVVPELNHNEMTGFDVIPSTQALSSRFHFLFLKSPDDHDKIAHRMQVLENLYHHRSLPVTTLALRGDDVLERIFSSFLLAQWTAYYLALRYGAEHTAVPMVEEFKKRLV